jgi:NADP-dependent 3-hydroxy acid dehydrogenase YdfG
MPWSSPAGAERGPRRRDGHFCGREGVRHPDRVPHPTRQRILITGASAGLGEGMARRFAAMGRDLALAARRGDRLEALRSELLAAHPGIRVETAELDVDDADAVARVVPELADRLGGIDRVIVNAGIGKGASIGTGKAQANRAVLNTNVLGAHAQCEAAMELFRSQGAGHLVLISSVASTRGMPQTRTAYGASKAAVNALAEGIRSDVWGSGIRVTTILPGYIATDINVGRRGPFTVELDKGVDALTAAIEREPVRAYVPGWPWRPIARLLKVLPLSVVRRLTRS